MSKKNIKIIVAAPVEWNEYPAMSKALDKLLEPYNGPDFQIEIVASAANYASKLPALWAAERKYQIAQFRIGGPCENNEDMVWYCKYHLSTDDAKLIAFTFVDSPEIMNLVERFRKKFGEQNITLITI